MQWLLLSVKIQKMISVWWFANKVTYHIDAERNPTGSIVGRTSNNEERSYHKMEVLGSRFIHARRAALQLNCCMMKWG